MDSLKQLGEIADLVWKDALVVFAIIWIYEGTRILVSGKSRRRGLTMLLPGIILIAGMASVSYWMAQSMDKLNSNFVRSYTSELPAGWGPQLTPEQRENNSRTYASVVFTSSGKLINYFDRAGSSRPYCPTEKEITSRDQTVLVNAQLHQLATDLYANIFKWLVWGSFAAILGWFAGRKKDETS